ncbi:uncharacterized protein METZ01_LOCUS78952 [marine metagenome]|uniref:Uncharacterized protein n=1 Tax=marine metagenome TaxID=408172 RepID=A0A381UEN0_9ZZZZ
MNYTRVTWGEKDSNLRRRTPADLQSAAIDRSAISPTDFFNFKRALFVEPAKGLEPPTI